MQKNRVNIEYAGNSDTRHTRTLCIEFKLGLL